LFALAPVSKKGFSVTFDGITNSNDDVTIDTLRTVTIKNMLKLGVNEIELKINKRGAPPLGGGSVFFSCGIVKSMKPINLMEEGRVKKIRGVAYSTKITPQMSNRLVESAKSILNEFIPDVYIYTDHFKGKESGNSPGFGLSLVAETTNGTFYSTEGVANPGELPEDIGVLVSKQLYSEIDAGGCVDTLHQWLFVLFMVLGPEDVSKVRFGRELTQQT
jgi:RNA 3'-terminal phosphate cyclase-like protein